MSPAITPPTLQPRDALLVKLSAPNLRTESRMPRGPERKTAVWNKLVAHAARTQEPVIKLAQQLKVSGAITGYELLVSPNAVIVDPTSDFVRPIVEQLGTLPGVEAVYGMSGRKLMERGTAVSDAQLGAERTTEPMFVMDVQSVGPVMSNLSADTSPWGLDMVGARAANAAGADGTGLVYGSIDSGADSTHEALSRTYRGTQPDGSQQHDYNWFDFGSDRSPIPVDPRAHGTHTIGTVLGSSDTHQIGVAPNASWISVNGLTGGVDVRLKAIQFMQAPTKRDGTDPRPELAPDVVGMSWSSGPKDGDIFADSLANLIAAGIEPVKSAGNTGNNPETIGSPGGHDTVFTAGAVDADMRVPRFSARGPSPLEHTGGTPIWKPDFAAPGVDVLSSVPGNAYRHMSGTSMAQPHLSGVVLALLSKFPNLTRSQIETVLAESAIDAGSNGRDLEFGHGIVNIERAIKAAATLQPSL